MALFSDGSEILSAFTTTPKDPDPTAYSFILKNTFYIH